MKIDVERLDKLARAAAMAFYDDDLWDTLPTIVKFNFIQVAKQVSALVLEEAAKAIETVSYRSRWMRAGTNSKSIEPCEHAQIIRALAKGVE